MQNAEKRFSIKNEDGSSYEVIIISDTEFKELINNKHIIFNEDLFELFGYKTFSTLDSKVIIEESGNYAIYPSRDLLIRQLEKIKGPYSRELLFEKNPFGNEFPSHAKSLIREFASKFHLQAVGGKTLLTSIDSVVTRNRNSEFFEKYYLLFIAIIGENIIEEKGGKWEMYLGNDKTTWSPYIKFKSKDLHFIHYIREDFFNLKLDNPLLNSYEDIISVIETNIEESK